MSNSQKGIATIKDVLIIVVAVVLIGGGAFAYKYWWEPKEEVNNIQQIVQDETANWKTHTYNNTDLKYNEGPNSYTFKYPADWIIINGTSVYSDEGSPTIGLENKNVKDLDLIGYDIGLSSPTITISDSAFYYINSTTGINQKSSYASIDNYITSIKNDKNQKLLEEKNITIGDKVFKRILIEYPINTKKYEYLINYPGSFLFVVILTPVINKELNTGEKIDNIKIIEEVLSTFKFVK
jgi:hypothetical protein